jgi:GTPase SAR1 family protein
MSGESAEGISGEIAVVAILAGIGLLCVFLLINSGLVIYFTVQTQILAKFYARKHSQREHSLLGTSVDNAYREVPPEITKQGRAAIQAYNAALVNGSKRLNWAKLMFVGQERVGKTSLLRNLTNQTHNPAETTTDGTDICIVETSDWVRLEKQPLSPSKFDQGVAHSVGNALSASKQQQLRLQALRKRAARVFACCIVLLAGSAAAYSGILHGRHTSPSTSGPTPAPDPVFFGVATAAPTTNTSAPTPVPTPAAAPARVLHIAAAWSGAGLFVFLVLYCMFRHKADERAKQIGLLPEVPTTDVLQKMPVDLIVEVMNGTGEQEHVTFSAWDFAGQDLYYSVHSLFITRGVYVVVFSMHEAQRDMPKCLEYLSFWMNSIHSHTSDPSEYHILIVGTHLDVVHRPVEHREISRQIVETFQNCRFWSGVQQPVDLCFFPIDNTQVVDRHSFYRNSLHAAVNRLGQLLVDSKNNEYPLKWLQVLDELQRKAEDGSNFVFSHHPLEKATSVFCEGPIADNLYSIAREHGAGESIVEHQSLCAFLAEVGSFLPFQNLLIVRPQWVADILFAVVTRSQFQVHAVSKASRAEIQQFELSAVVSERLLALLWARFPESPGLLIDVMLQFDLMFEFSNNRDPASGRSFLVPAMLPETKDVVEDVQSGELVRLNGLAAELQKIGACFDNGQQPPPIPAPSATRHLSDWPLSGKEPACFLVFQQKGLQPETGAEFQQKGLQPGQGFIPEGLWFTILVKCARWAQQTDSEWSREELPTSFRRDVARFSFGSQQFELRLHRAQHSIRLIVLGDSVRYPLGVLNRVRGIVDDTLAAQFPVLDYFVALRIGSQEAGSGLLSLDQAISMVQKRQFNSDSTFSSVTVDSVNSSMVAVDKDQTNGLDVQPWCPSDDIDTAFDIYISHSAADKDFAAKLYDCFEQSNTTSGGRVRVFLRDVSPASQLVKTAVAIRHSTIFVPVLSMGGFAACGSFGTEQIVAASLVVWQSASEWATVGMTVAVFLSNLAYIVKARQYDIWHGLFIASMLVPRLCNLLFLATVATHERRNNPRFSVWLLRNTNSFSLVGLLSCLRIENFALLRSRGLGSKLFRALPPVSSSVVNQSRVFGLVSTTLLGDLAQFAIAIASPKAGFELVPLLQLSVSSVSILHQIVLRGLACLLLSDPQAEHREKVLINEALETHPLLECMVASELCFRKQPRIAVLPLILDAACTEAKFSPDHIPADLVEQFMRVQGANRSRRANKKGGWLGRSDAKRASRHPQSAGTVLRRVLGSPGAVRLWDGGGLPVDNWNQCELAAKEVTARLGALHKEHGASPFAAAAHSRASSGASFLMRDEDTSEEYY